MSFSSRKLIMKSIAGGGTLPTPWVSSVMPYSAEWQSIAYGSGLFVAGIPSTGSTAYSTNGIDWSSNTTGGGYLAYGAGMFVSVNNGQTAYYSSDGINWSSTTMPSSGNWRAVTYGGGRFVAIASVSSSSYYPTAYSNDGITWFSGSQINSDRDTLFNSIAYGGMFVAAGGSNGTIAPYNLMNEFYYESSPFWQPSYGVTAHAWSSITYGNGKYVAVAGTANNTTDALAYSSNGVNWTVSNVSPFNIDDWSAVTFGNGLFVALRRNTLNTITVAYSYNGINWTLSSNSMSGRPWNAMAYGGGRFVAISSSSRAAYMIPN